VGPHVGIFEFGSCADGTYPTLLQVVILPQAPIAPPTITVIPLLDSTGAARVLERLQVSSPLGFFVRVGTPPARGGVALQPTRAFGWRAGGGGVGDGVRAGGARAAGHAHQGVLRLHVGVRRRSQLARVPRVHGPPGHAARAQRRRGAQERAHGPRARLHRREAVQVRPQAVLLPGPAQGVPGVAVRRPHRVRAPAAPLAQGGCWREADEDQCIHWHLWTSAGVSSRATITSHLRESLLSRRALHAFPKPPLPDRALTLTLVAASMARSPWRCRSSSAVAPRTSVRARALSQLATRVHARSARRFSSVVPCSATLASSVLRWRCRSLCIAAASRLSSPTLRAQRLTV
jgi:hypothetical protein